MIIIWTQGKPSLLSAMFASRKDSPFMEDEKGDF
jgi:hypothetical protein